ncbi:MULTISPECIES: YdgA family protein [unclassified Pseudomonas]|uniref:YdgA family protein n=1 Tax=unclassified Pseudomonas TaxID=196821 RepID=UPI000BCCF6ED|nr:MULTISPECIES: YdgA family protein [unclassified Pseudomonas]PVZ15349.1 uncharacterized protein YdgA (DUF945 family) [Pseudomonas sp. URIL14HWK12:I12]PVZ24723.1 uncharacterized protein YdgA (DUF945 family) [Pseudomonas sp. URIL14HWK12:I10]PVZ34568.1 uncharacterized protein YdgA (DUF945 family) [Pseudomonas sp. URIL14HWK12:I11]SNZ08679.1 Uncharacterized conserved protein YdgA, DUF945 family [Pseudomonas sp. URIL14HWK12:I9]
MSKSVSIIGGVVVILAGVACGGAWYTGTQIEPLLRTDMERNNQQLAEALAGKDISARIDLTGFERRWFSSTAYYTATFTTAKINEGQPVEVQVRADIEHGPFPWSRVSSFKLLPVLAGVHTEMVNTPQMAGWFALTKGVSPLQAQSTIGYDKNVQTTLKAQPFTWEKDDATLTFSGATAEGTGDFDGTRLDAKGDIGSFDLKARSADGPTHLQANNITFKTGGIKGVSGFYLGNSEIRIGDMGFEVPGNVPLTLKNLVGVGSLEELDGKLKGSVDYTLEQASIANKPVGSLQMRWAFRDFDANATRDLVAFYKAKVEPQAEEAAKAGEQFELQLSDADQAQLQVLLMTLLEAKPHIELAPLGLKTTNGESHVNLSVDFARPASPDLPPDQLVQQLVSQLDLKVAVAKATIQDIVTLQGQLTGQTDAAALARNAEGTANMLAGVAAMQGVARVDGNDIRSDLHFEKGMVDFNGQKMTLEQFVNFVMSKSGRTAQ